MSEQDLHSEIMRAVGRLEGKLDGIVERLDVSNGRLAKHDEKIADIDNWRSTMKGKISIWAGIIGLVSSVLASFIISKIK